MGGEKTRSVFTLNKVQGSPPHGRGKARGVLYSVCKERITPAWAGKRPLRPGVIVAGEDHPRMGGEKAAPKRPKPSAPGSPPHGRGKVPENRLIMQVCRITPAWAGKRRQARTLLRVVKDHPRMGGEKHCRPPILRAALGSPPHGRGKAPPYRVRPVGRGITPAWAGKSQGVENGQDTPQDHPRMGGEKTLCFVLLPYVPGSPPHGRGKAHSSKWRCG